MFCNGHCDIIVSIVLFCRLYLSVSVTGVNMCYKNSCDYA